MISQVPVWGKLSDETLESPVSDFEIDGKTFEVGGRKKDLKMDFSDSL